MPAEVDHFLSQFLILLRSDWTIQDVTYSKGSFLAIPIEIFLPKDKPIEITPAHVTVLFNPSFNTSLDTYVSTKDYLLLMTLNDVKTQIFFWKFNEENSTWILVDHELGESFLSFLSFFLLSLILVLTLLIILLLLILLEPQISGVSLTAFDRHESNDLWYTKESWTQPTTLYLVDASKGVNGILEAPVVKQLPKKFNFDNELREVQLKATSKDGTQVFFPI